MTLCNPKLRHHMAIQSVHKLEGGKGRQLLEERRCKGDQELVLENTNRESRTCSLDGFNQLAL